MYRFARFGCVAYLSLCLSLAQNSEPVHVTRTVPKASPAKRQDAKSKTTPIVDPNSAAFKKAADLLNQDISKRPLIQGSITEGVIGDHLLVLPESAIEAIRLQSAWQRNDDNRPMGGPDGKVIYTYGKGLPNIPVAIFHVTTIELRKGETFDAAVPYIIGDEQLWKVDTRRDAPLSPKHDATFAAQRQAPALPTTDGALQQVANHAGAIPPSLRDLVGRPNSSDPSYAEQNRIDRKQEMADDASVGTPESHYLAAHRTPPVSEFQVMEGARIPATIDAKVSSELPGELTAIVRQDVNDGLCGLKRQDGSIHCYVLIPAGSKLHGKYDAWTTYAQDRLQVVWTTLIFPDTSIIDLGSMNGHGADGQAGLHDKTNNHWGRIIGGVILGSVLTAGFQISQNHTHNGSVLNYPSTGEVAAASIGQNMAQLGQTITSRNLNIPPTIWIRPGQPLFVDVKKSIVFDGPYKSIF
jgi:type IV secretory pathway VirB10-like protein